MAKKIKANRKKNTFKSKTPKNTAIIQSFFDIFNRIGKEAKHRTEVRDVAWDDAKIEAAPPAFAMLDDEKKFARIMDGGGNPVNTTVINESGFYHLIFHAPSSEAKVFRKWVTNEILPSIRKTGQYKWGGAPKGKLDQIPNESARYKTQIKELNQKITQLEKANSELLKDKGQLSKANAELKEKVDLLAVEAECHEEDAIRMSDMIDRLKQNLRTKIDEIAFCVDEAV